MSTQTNGPWKYLERDPKSIYKQLSVKGKRIKARSIYVASIDEDYPRTPEELAEDFGVPVEAVLEAIEYSKSRPPEFEQDFQLDEVIAEATGMNDPNYKFNPTPKPLSPQERARILREHGYLP